MKARILTLFMALFAFAWSAKADEITSLKLTISHNGGEFREVSFPAEGWPDLDLTDESTTSIRIKRVEVQTSGTVSNVVFKATMYKTEKGLQPDDGWRTFDLPRQGNTWVLDFGDEAPDLIDSEMGPAPRTFQFFVQAQDGSGKAIYYNNGGQDYKVLFVNGGGSSSSGDIKNLTLTIRLNGGEAFTQDIPAENFPIVDLTDERTTSLIIVKVEVEAEESVSDIHFTGTMYSTSEGGQSNPDEWRSFPLQNLSNGKWELDMGEGIELVEEKWLNQNKTKTFEFYVQGTSDSGNQVFYNNGGANYKVTFSTGEGDDWKVKFLDEVTAELDLRVNDELQVYAFYGNGSRDPSEQPGLLSSLTIEQFDIIFRVKEGLSTKDVSLQYKVYEEGHADEGWWNRIDAQQYFNQGDNIMYCHAENLGQQVADGLEVGKNYVLEVCYQIVINGEYIFFGKDTEDCKFRFCYEDGVAPQEGIRSMALTINCDGEVFTQSFPSEGWDIHAVEGLTSSIKVMRVEVETSESLTYVGFCSTIYDTADGWQHDDTAWDWIPMENQGGGRWVLDWGEGRECVASEWLEQNVMKTLEFFADGGDTNGNKYKYANGISNYGYDNNYKVTFTPGVDPDGISLVSASKEDGATYNLAGQRVRKDYKGIVITNGRKVLIK